MKATIQQDIILRVGMGDTEIGSLPKGVGFERLRWDGGRVVDLAALSSIWVERREGVFVLHAVPVDGCQLVEMAYADRRRLIDDGGTVRLRTPAEIAAGEAKARAESRNAGLMNKIAADVEKGLMLDIIKLLYCLILATRQPNVQLGAWLDTQVSDMATTFEWANERARMERLIDALKARMEAFYAD